MIHQISRIIRNKIQRNRANNLPIDFPRLISFPRTGSHWLRIMLESYSKRPLLPRSFYCHNNTNFLICHSHDMQLSNNFTNVIYLHRNPVDVIYSQLNYYDQNIDNRNLIEFWTNQYAAHLYHWHNETFSTKKTIISYENLKEETAITFAKICHHLGLTYNENTIEVIAKKTTKEYVKSKTKHDIQVINKKKRYSENRELFKNKYSDSIISQVNSRITLI